MAMLKPRHFYQCIALNLASRENSIILRGYEDLVNFKISWRSLAYPIVDRIVTIHPKVTLQSSTGDTTIRIGERGEKGEPRTVMLAALKCDHILPKEAKKKQKNKAKVVSSHQANQYLVFATSLGTRHLFVSMKNKST